MKDIYFEFVDLDNDKCFQNLGKTLKGVLKKEALSFDNEIAKGELIKKSLNKELTIRKWKFTAFENIRMRKIPAPPGDEKKFNLLYVLNPTVFLLKNSKKKIHITGSRNNMFLTNEIMMDFHINPKQPFYVFDISFTASWLLEQMSDTDTCFKEILDQYLNINEQSILIEPFTIDEYKTIHELEVSMLAGAEDDLFISSRVYNLLCNFFGKVSNKNEIEVMQSGVHYDQIIQAEMMILENIKKPPRIEAIARKVNMSVSSLLRKFKIIYGKSIHEYYVEKKMELAKKMILENKWPIKEMAAKLGYNQASAFIETFTKQHGYSPGTLKLVSNQFLFF